MDFLSSLFNAIGDTFKAGAAVDTAKMANERARHERDLQYYAVDAAASADKRQFLVADAAGERQLITVILVVVAIVLGIVIFNFSRK